MAKHKYNVHVTDTYLRFFNKEESFSYDYFGMGLYDFETIEEWFTYILLVEFSRGNKLEEVN